MVHLLLELFHVLVMSTKRQMTNLNLISGNLVYSSGGHAFVKISFLQDSEVWIEPTGAFKSVLSYHNHASVPSTLVQTLFHGHLVGFQNSFSALGELGRYDGLTQPVLQVIAK